MNKKIKNKSSLVITLIGLFQIFIGIFSAFLCTAETYCYSLFTEGGRFHYTGFGFGSFMFGNITIQIWGYYIIALICIPLGYGHLKKQIWIQKISLTLLYVWFIVGIIFLPILLFIFVTSKEPSIFITILSAVIGLLSYTLIPFLLIRFYKSKNVECILDMNEQKYFRVKTFPVQLLMIISLYLFYIFSFHVLLLFKGIFPFFGQWLIGLKGIMIISLSILFFVLLIIGTIHKNLRAWWASSIYFCFFISSSIITLFSTDFFKIVTFLNFPETETKALMNIPLKGYHLSGIFGVPLIITLIFILNSKKYFTTAKRHESI